MTLQSNVQPKVFFAIAIFVGITALVLYWRLGADMAPGDYYVKKGNYRLEDGQFEQAVEEFKIALGENASHVSAHLGLAISYMQMKMDSDAMREFNATIELAPDLAVAYADRGILYDKVGNYPAALKNYKKALSLDHEVAKGPGWLWRFMRNIQEKPPTIRDRAVYIEQELQKPPEQRLLSLPEQDSSQRMYKIN